MANNVPSWRYTGYFDIASIKSEIPTVFSSSRQIESLISDLSLEFQILAFLKIEKMILQCRRNTTISYDVGEQVESFAPPNSIS